MNQQKLFTSFKWTYNSFGQRDRHLAHCARSEILPTLFCVVELFSVGLTVADLDLLYFCGEIELHFLLTDFLDHASPLKQPFHLQSTARSTTSCSHCLLLYIQQGKGFEFWCVICWSSSDCVNCTLTPHDALVCSGLSEIAVLPASFQRSFSVWCTLRPLKILVFPTCHLLLYTFLCLRSFLASRNIPAWPEKQERSWRIAHQTEKLGRHLFSVPACWHLSPAGLGAGVLKKLKLPSEWYSRLDTK